MSTSTISSPVTGPRGPRSLSKRFTKQVWHALTPSAEGPARGRTLEAVRHVMEARMDAQRLREEMPDLAAHADGRDRLWANLLPIYRRFVARVAAPAASTSIEVAGFLADLCEKRRPQRILELGTGFASAALRRLGVAPEWLPEIWSVDDDPARLARTRTFLAEESLSTEHVLSWREFRSSPESGFDLLVHELGTTPSAPLATVLDRLQAGGLLLLDGAHRPAAERTARQLLAEAGLEHWSLRTLTRDCYGRHALLARR